MPDEHGGVPGQTVELTERKRELRSRVAADRRRRSVADRDTARRRNSAAVLDLCGAGTVVCGFAPLPSEPLDDSVWAAAVSAGARVLLPVVTGAAPLDWVDYRAASGTRVGPVGIAEPVGPRLGPEAAATASLVVLPALAVDVAGARLGRGGGHYDRTVALIVACGGRPALVAVVYDEEVLAEVPCDIWDARVGAVITPAGGLRSL